MKYFVQRGHNPDWPDLIPEHHTWRLGEDIPEWLSDRAYITIISGDGIKNLGTRETSGGGIEIINSGKIVPFLNPTAGFKTVSNFCIGT